MSFTPKIKRLGKDNQEQLRLGMSLMQQKRLTDARTLFANLLEENPNSKGAHLGLGLTLLRQKDYDQALVHLQTVMRLDPLNPKAFLAAGQVYSRQENLAKAAEEFRSALNLDPKLAQAYAGLGQVLTKQKQFPEAIEQFKKALRLDPQLGPARMGLAQAYANQNKLDEAAQELKSWLAIDPENWLARVQLGKVYLSQGEVTLAKEAFQEVTRLHGDLPPSATINLVVKLTAAKVWDEASRMLRQLPQSPRLAPLVHKLWGDIFAGQGLHKEATEEYRASTLLAAEGGAGSLDLDSLELSDDLEDWEELANNYRASAKALLSDRHQRRRLIP